jgi:hypothetical protein
VMEGKSMLDFVHLHKTAFDRRPSLKACFGALGLSSEQGWSQACSTTCNKCGLQIQDGKGSLAQTGSLDAMSERPWHATCYRTGARAKTTLIGVFYYRFILHPI